MKRKAMAEKKSIFKSRRKRTAKAKKQKNSKRKMQRLLTRGRVSLSSGQTEESVLKESRAGQVKISRFHAQNQKGFP